MRSRLRLHLPNIIFQLINDASLPINQVAFKVPQNINKLDIRQYLTKIYSLPINDVRTINVMGKDSFRNTNGHIVKTHANRYKKAFVTLGQGQTFSWPKLPSNPEDLLKISEPVGPIGGKWGKNSLRHSFAPKYKPVEE